MQARCLGFLLLWASSLTGLGCRRHPADTAAFRGSRAAPPSRIAAAPAPATGAGPAGRGLPGGQAAPKKATIERIAAAGGDEDRYRILLRQGDFLTVTAEQHGLDVALLLTDAAGREILDVDSPIGAWGPETLDFVAASDGAYQLAVRRTAEGRPASARSPGRSLPPLPALPASRPANPPLPAFPAGQIRAARGDGFTLRIAEPRPALPADARRAEACLKTSAGDAAWRQGSRAESKAALRHYERAAGLWRSQGDDQAAAVAEIRMGRAWDTLGGTRQAVTHWEQALAWFRGRGRRDAPPSALCNNLGGDYMTLGRIVRARSLFLEAMAGAKRRGERYEEAVALNNLGILDRQAGDPWSALTLFEEARLDWREIGDRRGEGTTVENIGALYANLGRLAEAEVALTASQADLHAAGDESEEGLAAMNLGWLRFQAGNTPAALASLSQALALEIDAGNRQREGAVHQRLGMLYRDTGNLAPAVEELRRALALLGPSGDELAEAQTQSHLGEAITAAGDPRGGLRWEEGALARLRHLDDPATEAYAHFRRAQAERALGNLEPAREDMEIGLARIEAIRGLAQAQDLRISYLDSVHDQYERLVEILMELNAKAPGAGFDRAAVKAAESGRARSLLEIVAGARSLQDGAAQKATAARLREVDLEIDAAEAQEASASGHPAAATLEIAGNARLSDLLADRQRILVERTAAANGAAVRLPRIFGAEEIRREILDSDTTLLLYSLSVNHSFLFVLGREGQKSFVLQPRSVIAPAVQRLHSLLADDRKGRSDNQALLTAKEVSDLLLGPAARVIKSSPRIAIVADDILGYLPFAVLPAPGGDGTLLLATHEVVVLPSASVLGAIRRRAAHRRPAKHLLAVLSDPLPDLPVPTPEAAPGTTSLAAGQAPATEPAATRAARGVGLQSLPPLPWSRQEGAAILGFVPHGQGLGAVGAQASVELALSGLLADYDLLHFATHAFVNASAPELSGIVLAAKGADGRPAPGFLHSYEIADLRLPAELVVLSACRSGLGQALRGEGLLGLTQSFFTAGASRVVVSLWNVDDRATAQLMELFYRELLGGHRSPAAALRTAQLALRADPRWASPYYWAGFELQGDWRPLR